MSLQSIKTLITALEQHNNCSSYDIAIDESISTEVYHELCAFWDFNTSNIHTALINEFWNDRFY